MLGASGGALGEELGGGRGVVEAQDQGGPRRLLAVAGDIPPGVRPAVERAGAPGFEILETYKDFKDPVPGCKM